MKTLKQIIKDHNDVYINKALEKSFLLWVKEWLTQKRQETSAKIMYDPFIRTMFYDELLEDLEK